MSRLRDCSWWPSAWACTGGATLSAGRAPAGLLKYCWLDQSGLHVTLDHKGLWYSASIDNLSEPYLKILLPCAYQPRYVETHNQESPEKRFTDWAASLKNGEEMTGPAGCGCP
jgi:hypothetical protein